jgi:RHS repeat-associated protein
MATRPIVCRTPTPHYPPRGAAVLSVAGYEYGPYGEVVREDGWYAAHNRIGYRGQYRERVAGVAIDELVYHGYRYYSPRQGRFINRDPIGEAGGSNGYGYVWNDPVNRIDWLGLRGVWHGAGFEGGGSEQEDEPESADAAAISRVVERGRVLVSRVFGRWDVFPAIERVLAQGEVTAKQSGAAGQSGESLDGGLYARPTDAVGKFGQHTALVIYPSDPDAVAGLLMEHGFDRMIDAGGRPHLIIAGYAEGSDLVARVNYDRDSPVLYSDLSKLADIRIPTGMSEIDYIFRAISGAASFNTSQFRYHPTPNFFHGQQRVGNCNSFSSGLIRHVAGNRSITNWYGGVNQYPGFFSPVPGRFYR